RMDHRRHAFTNQGGWSVAKHPLNRGAHVAERAIAVDDGGDVHRVLDQDLEESAARWIERLRRRRAQLIPEGCSILRRSFAPLRRRIYGRSFAALRMRRHCPLRKGADLAEMDDDSVHARYGELVDPRRVQRVPGPVAAPPAKHATLAAVTPRQH